jgi:hypothetical protein
MFTMDGDPLPAVLPCRKPKLRPKTHIRDRVEPQGAMGEPPVQVDGRRDGSELGERQGNERNDPNVM